MLFGQKQQLSATMSLANIVITLTRVSNFLQILLLW